ncbi:MAG: sensor histidine kinase [Promethearchaeota archaeon]
MVLSGICAYGAYLADLMTKSTPNWGPLRSNIPFLIGFVILGLSNIISLLDITVFITKKKILNPLHQAIKQNKEKEKVLHRQKQELSQFAHMMSHDLRSNLTSIKGYLEIILTESTNEKIQGMLKKIEQIQDLLETSVKLADSGKVIDTAEIVDLHELTLEVTDTIIPKHINCNIDGLPMVLADKHRIYQVMKNILENAVIHGKPEFINIFSKHENGDIIIVIENDGFTIPNDFIESFNDPNFSLDFRNKGIGLKIVKRIIEAHNWKISITNDPQTTFLINIPETKNID